MSDERIDLLIAGGKGGVGKTTVATNIALKLNGLLKKTGFLDLDIRCPNANKIMGIDNLEIEVNKELNKLEPIDVDGMKMMSVGFDLPPDQYVKWKGERVESLVAECFHGVNWGELEYLVIDLPPGTGDELITCMQQSKNPKTVLVVQPTSLGELDATKTLNMLVEHDIPVIGVVENMTGMYGDGGGAELASEYGITFLGAIAFDKEIIGDLKRGVNIYLQKDDSFTEIVLGIIGEAK